tara:strand:- start:4761 stop:6149 length:1389 start_codon:yes stop_codon:yes gene_type:complete
MKKLIIYELNELPQKLLEDYILLRPNSSLSFIYRKGVFKKTLSSDIGELHPWSTWPTFYRGVDNTKHGLKFINQDKTLADKNFPPVWDILYRKKISIGIFGSLQSYPPPKKNKYVKFYLPDTFSPDSKSIPRKLEIFQEFNLSVVTNNNAISRNFKGKEIKNFFKCLINKLISLPTLFKIFSQVFKEILFRKYKLRRSLLQPIIGFEPYMSHLKKNKPSFSTFFTNHLAGMMHRYWYDYFPNDFQNTPRARSNFKKNSIIQALDIADSQIKTLIEFAKSNNYDLWIASSMGQDFIKRDNYLQELFLKKPNKLLECLELDVLNYNFLPAMYPDINIECRDLKSIKEITNSIENLIDSNNQQIIKLRYKPERNRINLIINSTKSLIDCDYLLFKKKKFNLKELGLELFKRDQGTGYHVPEGILLAYGNDSKNLFKKFKIIDTKLFAPLILSFYNLGKEKYMQDI